MEVIVYNGEDKGASLQTKPLPRITKPNQVIFKVKAAGICGSDVNLINGRLQGIGIPGVTIGHEASGVVTEIGSEVTNVKVGDRVALEPPLSCDKCRYCQRGKPNLCPEGGLKYAHGKTRDGGLAPFVLTDAKQVFKLDDDTSFLHGVLCEPTSDLMRAYAQMGHIRKDDALLVIGAGICGMIMATYLEEEGYTHVTVSQRSAPRRAIVAAQCPSVRVVDPETLDRERAENAGNREWGFDAIVDISGNGEAVQKAVHLLRPGGTLVLFGGCPAEARVELSPLLMVVNEWTVTSSLMQPNLFGKAVAAVGQMARNGRLHFDSLHIRTFPFAQWQTAFHHLATRQISKAVLLLED